MQLFFFVIVLAFSAMLHEVAHGYMANYLGDPTARLQGRLTLNPLRHVDPVGSILVPIFDLVTRIPFPAWAKPVPYNPYNLPGKYDEALVAAAGPATNIVLALFFGLIVRFMTAGGTVGAYSSLVAAFVTIAFANMLLGLFNIIPIPPLDGSKVLSGILPGSLGRAYLHLRLGIERLGFLTDIVILFLLVNFFSSYYFAALEGLFHLLTGVYF